jgi:hypothetical protein
MQSELYSYFLFKNLVLEKYEPANFFNHKVVRFMLGINNPYSRFLRTTTVLMDAPPKVHNALLLTVFNGWCTARRFGLSEICPFCSIWTSDCDLTHIMTCPIVFALGHHFLSLPRTADKTAFFNLIPNLDFDTLKRRSVHLYVLKRTFDFMRYNRQVNVALTYKRFIYKFVVEHGRFVSSFRHLIDFSDPVGIINSTR